MKAITWIRLAGLVLVLWGLKLILFGGTKKTGSYIELFGFEFGAGDREPMGSFECWFVGLALIGVGGVLLIGPN